MRLSLVVLFALASLMPTAQAQLFVDNELRQTAEENKERLDNITAVIRELNDRLNNLEEQNSRLRKQLAENSQQRQKQQQELREIIGALDEVRQQANNAESAKKIKPLSIRLRKLSEQITQLNLRMDVLEATSPPRPESELYAEAFTLLQEREYEKAINGFSNMLRLYPEGQFNINAQYWISQAFLSLQQFAQAKETAENLIIKHPKNDKEPDTLLIIAKASRGLQDKQRADNILAKLLELYPTSLAADEARQLLATE